VKHGDLAGSTDALATPSWHHERIDVVLLDVRTKRVAHDGDSTGHVRSEMWRHVAGYGQRLRRVEADHPHPRARHHRWGVMGQHGAVAGLLMHENALLRREVAPLTPVQLRVISTE
jgi:hypothetical protein